ncbi:NUDIX domain-containing protein [Kribbella amoyensis]|uniref:NUDIX domain-containing protein n=1 Tax=Kribbella amoyensis TaxID=996641 RepID=UPI0011AAA2ED|nr:NUDIX domain-containing protein [Kribbella amoyensis]
MRWKIFGERDAWSSPWLRVTRLDVEQPDGERVEYHGIRASDVAAAAVTDAESRVLMLWRHRLLTDTWGWELPMGLVEPGESPAEAAAREVEEETGWRPGPLRELIYAQPAAGIIDSAHHVFHAGTATRIG